MSKAYIEYIDHAMFPCYIGFTSNKKKFEKEMARIGVSKSELETSEGADATTWTLTKDGKFTIIVQADGSRKPYSSDIVGLVAHESVHVLDSILKAMREDSTEAGPETRAYAIQWLVQSFLAIYDREHKERKKRAKANKK